MPTEHVFYFVPEVLEEGALSRAAQRLMGKLGGDPKAVTVISRSDEYSDRHSYDKIHSVTDLRERMSIEFLCQLDVRRRLRLEGGDRVTVTLSGETDEAATALLEEFREELGLKPARCVALALSGGGLRATLFHLGVVRFLCDSGWLKNVTHICSVSGGSILAAHLVQNWQDYVDPSRFDDVARDLIDFARSDVRGRVFRRWSLSFLLYPLLRLGRSRRWSRTTLLQAEYDELYGHKFLQSLAPGRLPPDAVTVPEVYLLATAMKTGDMCSFTSRGLEVEAGSLYKGPGAQSRQAVGGALLPIAFAVTASSAFPPAFPPVRVTHETLFVDAHRFPQSPEYLSDGGVFDNLGLRKIHYLQSSVRYHLAGLVVCDAEAPFEWQVGPGYAVFWTRAIRSSDILMKRVSDMEYEWAKHLNTDRDVSLLRCRISDVVGGPGALPAELVSAVRLIRTDLDRFSDLEARCLITHGYTVGRQAMRASDLLSAGEQREIWERSRVPWDPLAPRREAGAEVSTAAPPDRAEPQQRTGEEVLGDVRALKESQRPWRRYRSAIFSSQDWVSWVALAALLVWAAAILAIPGIAVYSSRRADRLETMTQDLEAKAEGLRVEVKDLETRAKGLQTHVSGLETQVGDWRYYKGIFNELWEFQIIYWDTAKIDASLPEETRQLIKDGAPGQQVFDAYQRTIRVAGKSTKEVTAHITRRPPELPETGGAQLQVWSGFVDEFLFPGSDVPVFLQFTGVRETSASSLTMYFTQRYVDEEAEKRPEYRFEVVFTVTEDNNLQGRLPHPLLSTEDQEVHVANVHLWK